MNPCKNCIVRACCSQDCEHFKKFSNSWSTIAAFISIVISGFLTSLFIHWGSNKTIIFGIIWLLIAVINVTFLNPSTETLAELACILFAPYVFGILVQIYLYSFIFKKSVRKRV